MTFDDIEIYKKKKEEMERELKRKLSNDEERELYDSILDFLWKDSKISKEEISDEEISALKD